MINLCSEDHDEVCFEGRTCPFCEAKKDADREIEYLNDEIKTLEYRITKLENNEE